MFVTTFEQPFRHWIADGAFPQSLIEAALIEWPDKSWQHWHRYESADAVKLATRDPQRLTEACRQIYDRLCCLDVAGLLGVSGTFPDFAGYGAGMHWIPQGGHLAVHRDAATHPTTGWQRRLSVCLYLDDQYEGGSLDLFESDGRKLAVSIVPRPNRLVVFECGENSYHGVPDPVTESGGRKSIAAFFWSREPAEASRTSAEFII